MKRDPASLHRAIGIAIVAAIAARTYAVIAGMAIAARRNPEAMDVLEPTEMRTALSIADPAGRSALPRQGAQGRDTNGRTRRATEAAASPAGPGTAW